MITPLNVSILNGAMHARLEGELEVSGNITGDIINNLNSFDFVERVLKLMESPTFLNIMCEDPAAGTLVDASGNGRNGTYYGTWTASQRLTLGRTWKLNPNGTDNYISMADHDDFSFGDGSNDSPVTFFGLIEVVDTVGLQTIMSKYGSTGLTYESEYYVYIRADETLRLMLMDESVTAYIDMTTDVALSVGRHSFVITYDGSGGAAAADGITIYVDGILTASTAFNDANYVAMENSIHPLRIGAVQLPGGAGMGYFNKGDWGCMGIDASEWTVAKVWNFHQLCLANYSEDGVSL